MDNCTYYEPRKGEKAGAMSLYSSYNQETKVFPAEMMTKLREKGEGSVLVKALGCHGSQLTLDQMEGIFEVTLLDGSRSHWQDERTSFRQNFQKHFLTVPSPAEIN